MNLHAHTFFSYNAYGYSPSKYAWLARKAGLAAAGIVDFDVLDGLEEFLEAGRLLGLKTCVSLESRVFVPEFATRVINSPGEPGIAYHMGVGFTSAAPQSVSGGDARRRGPTHPRSAGSRQPLHAAGRTGLREGRGSLDAPRQRHRAPPLRSVRAQGRQVFPDPAARAAFWKQKLGDAPPPGPKLQNLIRAKTMKKGGVGYVQPGEGSFPLMADMNRFVLQSGAIPTLAWLDGTSDGEKCIEELFEVGHGLRRGGAEYHPGPQLYPRPAGPKTAKSPRRHCPGRKTPLPHHRRHRNEFTGQQIRGFV